ncbi:Peroxiredoxin-2 [Trichinella zimbabwensis]|uniref:thioredoxin-dependent peroxiredoxin n=1 Tax=Trichinella zimbabwensis TaxID=268475 RepID=A0A0V1I872_9BILA|nr:Peroxiredoxin-2 [Trichinella zimbabwensis]
MALLWPFSVGVVSMNRILRVGKPAPFFGANAVFQGSLKFVRLSDFRGRYLVLFFYPRDFTKVCPTEVIALNERVEDFKKLDCDVLACSTDSEFSHIAWMNVPRRCGGLGEMNIPILADTAHHIAKDYNVYDPDHGLALRGVFIIDRSSILRQIIINDLQVGRNVDEVLRLVQAYRHTDDYGEMCPANWKPGSLTIDPHPDQCCEYFAKTG